MQKRLVHRRNCGRAGFTWTELLVVIAFIVTLGTLGLPASCARSAQACPNQNCGPAVDPPSTDVVVDVTWPSQLPPGGGTSSLEAGLTYEPNPGGCTVHVTYVHLTGPTVTATYGIPDKCDDGTPNTGNAAASQQTGAYTGKIAFTWPKERNMNITSQD